MADLPHPDVRPAARPPSSAQGLAGASGLNFVGSISVAASNVILLLLLTRSLGSGGAGAFLEAVALVTIATTAATLGADTGLIKALAESVAQRRSDARRVLAVALAPVLLVGTAAAGILLAAAEPIAQLVGDRAHAGLIADHLRAMAPFVPVGAALMAILGGTRGLGTMTPTVVLDRLTRPVLQAAALIAVLAAGGAGGLLGIAWAAPSAVALVLAITWGRRLLIRSGVADGADVDLRATARRFWAFTLPRALASGLQILVQWLDVLLVGALMSAQDAAVYAVATRVLQLGFFAVYAIGQAIQPRLAGLWAVGERQRLQEVYQRSTTWTVAVVWPVFTLAAVAAPAVLGLFGPEFTAGAAVVAVLAASGLYSSAVGSVDMVLLMAGRSTANLSITAVGLATNVALNLVLIPRMGILGAAVAWAASRVLTKSLSLRHVRHHVGVHPFSPGAARAGLAALAWFGVGGTAVRLAFGAELVPFLLATPALVAGYLHAVRAQTAGLRALLERSRRRRPHHSTTQAA